MNFSSSPPPRLRCTNMIWRLKILKNSLPDTSTSKMTPNNKHISITNATVTALQGQYSMCITSLSIIFGRGKHSALRCLLMQCSTTSQGETPEPGHFSQSRRWGWGWQRYTDVRPTTLLPPPPPKNVSATDAQQLRRRVARVFHLCSGVLIIHTSVNSPFLSTKCHTQHNSNKLWNVNLDSKAKILALKNWYKTRVQSFRCDFFFF